METRGHLALHADRSGELTEVQKVLLGSMRTDCLLGTITVSTRRCNAPKPQDEMVQIYPLNQYIKRQVTALVKAGALELHY